MGIAARSSVRIEASLPPYRPNGVRMASQMYAVSMVTLRISSRRAADVRGQASPIERFALRSQVGHLLLLFDMYGLQQCEIERRFRRQRDIAIAGESRTAGTRRRTDQRTYGSALAATSDRPDRSSSRSTAAHHDRRALDRCGGGYRRCGTHRQSRYHAACGNSARFHTAATRTYQTKVAGGLPGSAMQFFLWVMPAHAHRRRGVRKFEG